MQKRLTIFIDICRSTDSILEHVADGLQNVFASCVRELCINQRLQRVESWMVMRNSSLESQRRTDRKGASGLIVIQSCLNGPPPRSRPDPESEAILLFVVRTNVVPTTFRMAGCVLALAEKYYRADAVLGHLLVGSRSACTEVRSPFCLHGGFRDTCAGVRGLQEPSSSGFANVCLHLRMSCKLRKHWYQSIHSRHCPMHFLNALMRQFCVVNQGIV